MPVMVDWLGILDFPQALVNCHRDFLGDWHRDPWGWPEFDWAVQTRPELLSARLNSAGAKRVAKIDIPKENFATRPAVVLDPMDRLVYQALVDRLSSTLSTNLPNWAYGWRLPRQEGESGRYTANKDEWSWYRARLKRLARRYSAALLTDVVSFFASIPIDRLAERIRTRSRGRVSERLVDFLTAWDEVVGRSGLPQRCLASSVLANVYLRSVDDELDRHAPREDRTVGAARWMDDYWLFGDSEGALRRSQLSIEAAMREVGLNMGAAKTKVLEGDAVVSAVATMEHSAADEGLAEDPPNTTALDGLIDEIMSEPEGASRTSIRFMTSRIRDKEYWRPLDRLLTATPRMPQGADHIARVFRDSGRWRDLEQWYLDYCDSDWASLPWSTGQLATMFPSAEQGQGIVRDLLAGHVADHAPISLSAVAVHRLAHWAPDTARQAMREAARTSTEPHERRILALAALGLGDEPAFIRRLLREFEENRVTIEMIEYRDFRPLPDSADFA